jgi:hypothetical protein
MKRQLGRNTHIYGRIVLNILEETLHEIVA